MSNENTRTVRTTVSMKQFELDELHKRAQAIGQTLSSFLVCSGMGSVHPNSNCEPVFRSKMSNFSITGKISGLNEFIIATNSFLRSDSTHALYTMNTRVEIKDEVTYRFIIEGKVSSVAALMKLLDTLKAGQGTVSSFQYKQVEPDVIVD